MDLFVSYPLQLAILCISLALIFRVYRHDKSPSPKLPPGSKGWPIIGETLIYGKACLNGNPFKFVVERMNRYAPEVFRTSLFGEDIAVFCGAAGNKFLFSTANKNVTPWWPRSIAKILHFPFDMESFKEESFRSRSMLPEFFKVEALQRYISIMVSVAEEHMEIDWAPYKEVKVFPLAKKYTFAVSCRLFVNVTNPEHVTKLSNLYGLIAAGLISIPVNLPGTAFSHAIKAGKFINNELLDLIRHRKIELMSSQNKGSVHVDLLSRMLLIRDENGREMDERVIAALLTGLFIGSFDTSTSTITSVMNNLADYPHVYSEVLREQMEIANSKGPNELLNWDDIQKMKYSWTVVCETLRLLPPGPGAFREVKTELTYANYKIPKGWKAFWTLSTHKDPEFFPDPEKFDPSRFQGKGPAPYTFVPFGGGPRMCPGKEYARVIILTFLHNVVTKFKWEKVDPNEKIKYEPTPIPVNGLLVRLQKN
ncbi:Beta-amyrin 28-oxidase [Morella rubra]|uniref:Beta-amyrin 28-oxidase n=1 Tax=Morella rubra TaxID=262757 RepID=A0A6A1VDV2_9ROSI|nr:Beta-amyrin 28-oxidase [Morella rubra]